jgi:hypothetical protein
MRKPARIERGGDGWIQVSKRSFVVSRLSSHESYRLPRRIVLFKVEYDRPDLVWNLVSAEEGLRGSQDATPFLDIPAP